MIVDFFFTYDEDKNYSSTVHLILDTTIPDQIDNLAAVPGDGQVELSWINPDENFVGVKVVYSTVATPNNYLEGTVIYEGTDSSYLHNQNVNNGIPHYYSAFTYKNVNTYSFPVSITATPYGNPNTNEPPVVNITGSSTGEANSVVNFTRTANDPDGHIVASHWDFGDGYGSNNWSTTTHIYAQPGQYIVTATATDDDNATGTDSIAVEIKADVTSPINVRAVAVH